MPAIEDDDRLQKAVYWEATNTNDEFGNPVYLDPVEIDVRWITKRKQGVDSKGNPIALEATVIADVLIPIDSTMWEGTLEEWYGTGSAGKDDELMVVKANGKTPDLRAIETRYKAFLSRYRDQPPNR